MLQIDDRREYLRWMACGATVLGVHLASVAGYLLWTPVPALPAAPPPAAMMVELAALPSNPAPAVDAAPGPEQVENQPEPKPEPEPEPEEPLEPLPEPEPPTPDREPEVALPEPKPEPKPKPRREEPPPQLADQDRPVVEQTSAPVATAAPAAAESAGAPGVDAAIQADALLTYQQRLLAHLERHRRYPYAARKRRQEGIAHLAFVMNKRGEILSFQLEKSSGHRALDKEVLAMISRAAPLPAIPEDLGKDRLELVIPVEFFIRNSR